jgi:hypothetical protein
MRTRTRFVLLLVPALTLLGATCVTSTQQRDPAGPWVGEVVNNGPEPMDQVQVVAHIVDASGHDFGTQTAYTCPSNLLPGERGAFELFFQNYDGTSPTLPLHADISPVTLGNTVFYPPPGDTTGEGLTTQIVGTYPAKRVAVAEIRNESPDTYSHVEVCATLRTPGGALAEVGSARLFPSVLRPGATGTVTVFFNSMPEGHIDVNARGATGCCVSPLLFDPAEFQVSATRVTHGVGGRMLVLAGEMRNRAGQDLRDLQLGAYAEGAPETRVIVDLGCNGAVGTGDVAAAAFAIPLDSPASRPVPVVLGIEATSSSNALYRVPASGVAIARLPDQSDGLGTVAVGAKLQNPTSKWLSFIRACATVRDRRGHAIGVAPLLAADSAFPYLQWIAPGATVGVSGVAFVLDEAASAEVQAYAEPQNEGPVLV